MLRGSQFYQYDERGNVLMVTSASGEVEAGCEPDAYGDLAFAMDKNGNPLATRPDIFYTGKDFDDTTGLYYFNARWYDPETGRFLSRATYQPDEEHAHSLCEGNPISFVDPQGSSPESETAAFVLCAFLNMNIPKGGCGNYADMMCGPEGDTGLMSACLIRMGVDLKCCKIRRVNPGLGLLVHSMCQLVCKGVVVANTDSTLFTGPGIGIGILPGPRLPGLPSSPF